MVKTLLLELYTPITSERRTLVRFNDVWDKVVMFIFLCVYVCVFLVLSSYWSVWDQIGETGKGLY